MAIRLKRLPPRYPGDARRIEVHRDGVKHGAVVTRAGLDGGEASHSAERGGQTMYAHGPDKYGFKAHARKVLEKSRPSPAAVQTGAHGGRYIILKSGKKFYLGAHGVAK